MAGQGELAREVRAGLTVINGNKADKPESELDRLWYRKPIRRHVNDFAALFASIFLFIAAWQIYREKPPLVPGILIGAAAVMLILGYLFPAVLRPVWSGWMKFAQALGFVMTGLILFVAWCVVLMPISFLVKAIRIKVLNTDFRTGCISYWEDREAKLNDFKLLDRQF